MIRAVGRVSRLRALLLGGAGTLLLILLGACEELFTADRKQPPAARPSPALAIADSSAAEAAGSVSFIVTLSRPSAERVTVRYATADGTATAGDDYSAVTGGALTFAAGDTAATITVTIVADARDEPEAETFTVTLSEPRHARLADATATGTIFDDDLTLAVAADAATVVEGGAATFTVTVTGGAAIAPVAARYEVGGTAEAGADYELPSRSLTLAAGADTGTITIRTLADAVLEPGETLDVTLVAAATAAGTVALDPAPAVTAIMDVGMVTASVAAAQDEVAEGDGARFAVALTGAVASPVSLGWATADGTATAGADYAAVPDGTLTFRPGAALVQEVEVATLDDDLPEEAETFTVTLTGMSLPEGVTLGAAGATVTILDDDPLVPGSGDDHGDTPATATAMVPGTTIYGRLESAADVDYFKLSVRSTGTLIAATDPGKARDPAHEDYRTTVVGIEGPHGVSSAADHYAEVSSAVPGTWFIRVAGDAATRYDLAVWLFDPTAQDPSFDIDLRFLGTQPSARQARTIRAAAAVWEGVITRGLPPRNILASDEWQCEPGDPSLFGVHIDDLLVNIRLEPIDGPGTVLATAGPCRVRRGSGLPYLGDVLFDTADLPSMEQAGVLRDTALHEIAHVLGFGLGSLWDGLLREPSVGPSGARVPGQDTHFRGEAAIAAFDAVGGSAYAGAKVPVENDTGRYGRGALDTHWRESVFGEELMTTAVVLADGSEPLSLVTVAALEDLGYQVDRSRAQPYQLPSVSSLRQTASDPARVVHLRNDVRKGPIIAD